MLLKILIFSFLTSEISSSVFYDDDLYLNITKNDFEFKSYFNPMFNETLQFVRFLSGQMEIRQACRSSLSRWVKGLENNEQWALKFFESTGKVINGRLLGRNANFGSYDYCVEFRSDEKEKIDFDGKYCLMSLQTKESELVKTLESYKNYQIGLSHRSKQLIDYNLGSAHGVCMPSTCDVIEVTLAFNRKFENSGFKLMPPKRCTTSKEPEPITNLQIISLTILSTFIMFCILSLFVDNEFLSNFSLVDNYNIIYKDDLYRINEGDESAEMTLILHGKKAFMVLFSTAAHCYCLYTIFFPFPLNSAKEISRSFENNQITIAVLFKIFYERFQLYADQLFFIGGFFALFAWYTILKRNKLKFNFPVFFFGRYIRMSITIIPVILIYFLLPLFGEGPLFSDLTNHFSSNCQERFYYIFMLSAYKDKLIDMCLIPGWFLNVDFLIYIINYFLIYYLIKKPVIGFALCIDYKIYDIAEVEKIYFNLHSHYNTYVLGLLTAYLVRNKIKFEILSNKLVRIAIWIIILSLCGVIFWYPYYLTKTKSQANEYIRLTYFVFDKIIFSLLSMWTFYSTLMGYSNFLKSLLSLRIWVPISRLSFSIIVSQFLYLGYTWPTFRVVKSLHFVSFVKEFVACLICTFIIANFIFLFFEAPMISLTKKYLGLKSRQQTILKLNLKQQEKTHKNSCIEEKNNSKIEQQV